MQNIRTRMRALAFVSILLVAASPFGVVVAQEDVLQTEAGGGRLPDVAIDALEGDSWSVDQVLVAPGQRLVLTNRDVERHNFSVAEWGVDIELLTLSPVEVMVPDDVEPGENFTFASTRGNDREQGMEGTLLIVTPEQILASVNQQNTVSAGVADRIVVTINDSFSFSPSAIHVSPGTLIEIRNSGSIEHHFVVDAWALNETIGPGKVKLVHVPQDAQVGESIAFYCSIPGHRELGMEGVLNIVPAAQGAKPSTDVSGVARVSTDLRPFIPAPDVMGEQWTQLRTGNADSIVARGADINAKVFPGDGLGAAYVGPAGSRVTVVVMPLRTDAVPINQVEDAILGVQSAMMQEWTTDRLSAAAMKRIPPPQGCDVASRASGIVPVLTLPAGSTVCELRNTGVAIFVAVEGEIDGRAGVDAADALIVRLLSGDAATGSNEGFLDDSSTPANTDRDIRWLLRHVHTDDRLVA